MIKIDKQRCTGCSACVQKCVKNCITWQKGEFDFLYPLVKDDLCIDCGLCERVCPIHKSIEKVKGQKVYALVSKKEDVLKNSTSGGAFSVLADFVFEKDGVLYGVIQDTNQKVKHIRVSKEQGYTSLQGSKYVQSYIGNTFIEAQKDLQEGKWVLYSGTPCQIDGLKSFLGKSYDKLITVDIVCHGVGSQAYFDKFMDSARGRFGNIQNLKFRSKEFVGWSIGGSVELEDKTIPFLDYENYYYSYFLSGNIYRESCYTCKYANTQRVGDFSLGDYWGVEALHLPLDTQNGCSLLLVNTDKGNSIFKELKNIHYVETTIEQASFCNKQLNMPTKKDESRDVRLNEFKSMSGKEIEEVYISTHKKKIFKGKLKRLIPYRMKIVIRSMRKSSK